MKEYKKLLILLHAIRNLKGINVPINIFKENIEPLNNYVKHRINEIEEEQLRI